jgi:hypothetical protein
MFSDPRQPDFEMSLWPAPAGAPGPASAAAAVRQANTWLARTEALLRHPSPGPPVIRSDEPDIVASESERRFAP